MISTFLHWGSMLVYPIWLGLAAISVAIGAVLLRQRDRGRPALLGMLGLALALALGLTLVPTGQWSSGQFCSTALSTPSLLSPEPFSNVGLFVPLGLFATLALRAPFVALAGGSLVSATIEATQAYATAIGRACDANDWMLNSLGTTIGVGFAVVLSRLVLRRRPAGRASALGPRTPSPGSIGR